MTAWVALSRGSVSRFGYEADCLYQTICPVEKLAKNSPGLAGHDKEPANAAHRAVVPWFGAGSRSSSIEMACTLDWTWPGGHTEECRATADDRREATAADNRSDRSRRYPVRPGGPAELAMNPCSAWGAVYPTDTRRERRRS